MRASDLVEWLGVALIAVALYLVWLPLAVGWVGVYLLFGSVLSAVFEGRSEGAGDG